MRFRLRTLLIAATIGPPILAGAWFALRLFVRRVPIEAWPLLFYGTLPYIGLFLWAMQKPTPPLVSKMIRYPGRWVNCRRNKSGVRLPNSDAT
jgi:hypothetical protein